MTSLPPLSPGEQPRSEPENLWRILALLLGGAALIAFVLLQWDLFKEYLRYFADDRKPASLDFTTLSESWTERTLEQRFAGNRIDCAPYQGPLWADRACAVDAGATNGIPVLYASFFFLNGQLTQMAVNIPWWVHLDAYRQLARSLGPPANARHLLGRGSELHQWRLANGSGVFFNRRRSINPLQWNTIYWRSPSVCPRTPARFDARAMGPADAGGI